MKGYEQKVPEDVRKQNDEKLVQYATEIAENEKSVANLTKFLQ